MAGAPPAEPASEAPAAPAALDASPAHGATYALAVLSGINLVHFLDRFIITAVLPPIQRDLTLSDAQGGMLGTAFIVVFMLAAPVFGRLADAGGRTRLIAAGVAVWSAATAAAGLARGYAFLLATRAVVGIGEAAYATISPTIIADLFPARSRARAMSVYFACMPVGAALGFILGGFVEKRWGWRAAFLVAGLPGLLLALLAATVRDPERGRFERGAAGGPGVDAGAWAPGGRGPGGDPGGATDAGASAPGPVPPLGATLRALATNVRYVLLVAGYTAYVFAVGGLAFWMPTFLHRVRDLPLDRANLIFGAVTVIGGFAGSLAGGWLADRLLPRFAGAHAVVAGASTLLAAPALLAALLLEGTGALFAALLLAEVLLFASMGPVNTAIVNVVPPAIRASAVSVSILVQHLLGDAISPTIIGWVSDAARARALAAGAAEKAAAAEGLLAGTLVVPGFVVLGGLLWIALARGPRPAARAS